MTPPDNTAASVTNTIVAIWPGIVQLVQLFHTQSGAPAPTEAEIRAGFEDAFVTGLAKGEAWKAAHPIDPGT